MHVIHARMNERTHIEWQGRLGPLKRITTDDDGGLGSYLLKKKKKKKIVTIFSFARVDSARG